MSLTTSTFFNNRRKAEIIIVGIIAILMIVVFPILNSNGVISNFTLSIWGKYFSFALLAISVDMLWGYMGLLSLGQALFFSLGGYMLGMYLMRAIDFNGIPPFLGFLGFKDSLPAIWQPFSSFPFAVAMVLIVPGLLALAFGFLAFRSRIKGVYFSILTQALTYGAYLLFSRQELRMGGDNGFTDFRTILGYDIRSDETQRTLYVITALTVLLTYIGLRWLNNTKFGLVQRAIRDSENRVLFSGYASAHYKLFIFVLSAMIAAIGGALFVTQVRIINPGEMTTVKSLEAVVWCAIGGRGTIVGPIIGAVGVNSLKSWASREYPDLWLFILGLTFMFAVLFMPKGLVGLPAQLKSYWAKWRPKDEPDPSPSPPGDDLAISDAVTETNAPSTSAPASNIASK
ncbi:urea ABC transporter permease subunit UrtC [Phragmitibacter flavus]|uniref:Urea ABC transporter permease subunit UrtC n=1 Tax=Phragmitibacter flavus TaxID=2576071 RepID=A0A5R8KF65_9BACT|nr:urea ABC transporter permease subunit UrtC [Phragmitibacter flavus]TLD70938.1 urea ABC transporter permease subunit UrtC [Phragmitibacter flavus]